MDLIYVYVQGIVLFHRLSPFGCVDEFQITSERFGTWSISTRRH